MARRKRRTRRSRRANFGAGPKAHKSESRSYAANAAKYAAQVPRIAEDNCHGAFETYEAAVRFLAKAESHFDSSGRVSDRLAPNKDRALRAKLREARNNLGPARQAMRGCLLQ